ncbi:hypothetical protein HanPI659440_Chr02g0089321 [Helianthus annuus]|nr:hypothetical protein HanPI659440_Chr02g0089321 [Helianthus annuus]
MTRSTLPGGNPQLRKALASTRSILLQARLQLTTFNFNLVLRFKFVNLISHLSFCFFFNKIASWLFGKKITTTMILLVRRINARKLTPSMAMIKNNNKHIEKREYLTKFLDRVSNFVICNF